ncbi:MAG: hypothetical protein ABEJ66_03960, partial [Candidatus Nanohaloarchaea archaeon]
MEAGVGRYPATTGDASALYHRSLVREKGNEAVVAAEYMHGSWPVILASMGGGMWHGKNIGYQLAQQGYNVTRLVEYRSHPLMFILELFGLPRAPDTFFMEFKSHQKRIAKYLGRTSVSFVKNAVFVVRGFERAERTLQFYLEFDWTGWQPFRQDLDFPQEASVSEIRELLFSALPDRYGHLTEENVRQELEDADIFLYHGIGNSERWVLPGKKGYSGVNNVTPGEIPGLSRPVVWDSSVEAGKRNSDMKQKFLERGAAAYLGVTGNSYSAYTAAMARVFFSHGGTTGRSLKRAVNHLRSNALVYHPNSLLETGARAKMKQSLVLYGNPEMVKDPVEKEGLNTTRSCEKGVCRLEIHVNPDPDILVRNGRKRAVFNTSDYLMRPFAPITPLYSYRRELPEGSEVVSSDVSYSYREVEGLEPRKKLLLGHGGTFVNRSGVQLPFPGKLYRLNESMVEYVQAAVQYRENGSRILEQATAVVKYRSPATLELERDRKKVVAEIYTSKERSARLSYSMDGRRVTRQLELDEG